MSTSPTGIPSLTTAPPTWRMRAFVEQIMGLPISIHVRAADPRREDIEQAVQSVWRHLAHVDEVLSTWREDSDLMRVRRGELAEADADPMLAEVKRLCERAEAVSDGLFTTDLTGPDGTRGWDPTGLTKGWAVARAADRLRELAGVRFCINAGGDIVAGSGSDVDCIDPVWRIGIEDPTAPGTIVTVVPVTDGALATSGTAARGAHIVDPRSGRPAATSGLTSITVIGPDLTWVDVWATVCFIDPAVLQRAGTEWSDYHVVSSTP